MTGRTEGNKSLKMRCCEFSGTRKASVSFWWINAVRESHPSSEYMQELFVAEIEILLHNGLGRPGEGMRGRPEM